MDVDKSSIDILEQVYNRVQAQEVRITDIGEDPTFARRGNISTRLQDQTFAQWVDRQVLCSDDAIFIGDIAKFVGDTTLEAIITAGQIKNIVKYLISDEADSNGKKVGSLVLSDIKDLDYDSLCLLFYLKSQRPRLEISVDTLRVESLQTSGVSMWQTFATFNGAVDFDNLPIPSKEEHSTQVADYRTNTMRVGGGAGGNGPSLHGPTSSQPMHPIMIAGIACTAVGTATALTGLGSALAGADFAFYCLPGGDVMLYQAMILGGSILAFLGISTILLSERHEARNRIIAQYGNGDDSKLAMVGKNFVVYAPAVLLAVEGGIGLMAAYSAMLKGGFGMTEIMVGAGGGLLFVTLVAAGGVIVIDKVNDKPIDWPFVAQVAVGGLAATAVATMLPWVMANTNLFADPMMASISVCSAMAVVPLLGLIAKGVAMGIQGLVSEGPART